MQVVALLSLQQREVTTKSLINSKLQSQILFVFTRAATVFFISPPASPFAYGRADRSTMKTKALVGLISGRGPSGMQMFLFFISYVASGIGVPN